MKNEFKMIRKEMVTVGGLIFAAIMIILFPDPSYAKQEPSAYKIMEKNYYYINFKEVTALDMVDQTVPHHPMVRLIRPDGKERARDAYRYFRSHGKQGTGVDYKSCIILIFPPEMKGLSFVQVAYHKKTKEDNYWMFLPLLRRVRRITAGNQDDAWIGSDITYGDLGSTKPWQEDHRILGTDNYPHPWLVGKAEGKPTHPFKNVKILPEPVGGECWVVESIPKWKAYYAKKKSWCRKSDNRMVLAEYFDATGKKIKTYKRYWMNAKFVSVPKTDKDKIVQQAWYVRNELTGHISLIDFYHKVVAMNEEEAAVIAPEYYFTQAYIMRQR